MMCLSDYGDSDFTLLRSGERRARIAHKCDECWRSIDPGESYRYWVGIDHMSADTIVTTKMCAHCWATIDLGATFTGCPRYWYWERVHDMDPDEGGFVGDIIRNHELTLRQARLMVRCVRGRRRPSPWRKADGTLLPIPAVPA